MRKDTASETGDVANAPEDTWEGHGFHVNKPSYVLCGRVGPCKEFNTELLGHNWTVCAEFTECGVGGWGRVGPSHEVPYPFPVPKVILDRPIKRVKKNRVAQLS